MHPSSFNRQLFLTLLIILFISTSIWAKPGKRALTIPAIDPQIIQDQDEMTWNDYKPIPGKNWADPSLKPGRQIRIALIAIDFPDQPFVVTQPKHTELFGNPQIDAISREKVEVRQSGRMLLTGFTSISSINIPTRRGFSPIRPGSGRLTVQDCKNVA